MIIVPSLFVLQSEDQDISLAEAFSGDELVVLVVVDRNKLAARFEESIQRLEKRAAGISSLLRSRGVACRTLFEWGDVTESVSNTVAREDAVLLNKPDEII